MFRKWREGKESNQNQIKIASVQFPSEKSVDFFCAEALICAGKVRLTMAKKC
jgi:hypothetical protein